MTIENSREVCGEPIGDLFIRTSALRGVELDGEVVVRAIDEMPIVAVVAAFARGTTTIRGAEELRVKESDRIRALALGLNELGVRVGELPDGLVIEGGGEVQRATVQSFDDHRIAMAFSIAGLASTKPIEIAGAASVAISFPGFYSTIRNLNSSAPADRSRTTRKRRNHSHDRHFIKSRDHTERMLPAFGGRIRAEGTEVTIDGEQELRACDVEVPGDLSSAAFFIGAALIVPGSELYVRNVGLNPTRTGVLDIFRMMGGTVTIENSREVCGEPIGDLFIRTSALRGVELDGEVVVRAIDEMPIVAVVAAFARGTTTIRGAEELRFRIVL